MISSATTAALAALWQYLPSTRQAEITPAAPSSNETRVSLSQAGLEAAARDAAETAAKPQATGLDAPVTGVQPASARFDSRQPESSPIPSAQSPRNA